QNRAFGSLQGLRERREVARNAILQLRDQVTKEDRDFNTEERASWDAANKDYDELGRRIVAWERGEVVGRGNLPGNEDTEPSWGQRESDADLAVAGWIMNQLGQDVSERQIDAAQRMKVSLTRKYIDIPFAGQTRAQGVGTGSLGGFSVPTSLA